MTAPPTGTGPSGPVFSSRLKIHPAADLFPMMSDDELQELAADIAANGLIHPIILDDQKQIIDGRNRLKACELAGIKPTFEQLNRRDPLAFIVSANLARRNLTKGQQAMALAFIYPEPEKGGRGKNVDSRKAADSAGFGATRLRQARLILRELRPLAEAVLKGTVPFDDALAKAEELKQHASSADAKLQRLTQAAPDLAARVTEETISLDEALAILAQREAELRRIKADGRAAAQNLLVFAGHVSAVCAALDAGEAISIPRSTLETLRGACQLLASRFQED